MLAATDAVDRAALEAAAIAAGLVLEAEDNSHRGIVRLVRGELRIERLGERARRDQRAAVDRHRSARQPWAQSDREAEYQRSRDGDAIKPAETRVLAAAAIRQAVIDLVIDLDQHPRPPRN